MSSCWAVGSNENRPYKTTPYKFKSFMCIQSSRSNATFSYISPNALPKLFVLHKNAMQKCNVLICITGFIIYYIIHFHHIRNCHDIVLLATCPCWHLSLWLTSTMWQTGLAKFRTEEFSVFQLMSVTVKLEFKSDSQLNSEWCRWIVLDAQSLTSTTKYMQSIFSGSWWDFYYCVSCILLFWFNVVKC